jgi:hypothetical protein
MKLMPGSTTKPGNDHCGLICRPLGAVGAVNDVGCVTVTV